jgi:hypothetical protein
VSTPDPTVRRAAVWAAVVAVPVAVLVAYLLISAGYRNAAGPAASPSPTAPRPQSTGPVIMPARPLPASSARVCRSLVASLPPAIRTLPRRPVTAGPEQNAAYGDPAITVACGVATPSFAPTAFLLGADGLCWYPAEHPDVTVFTTLDRAVPVRVTVPRSYSQAGFWVNEFGAAVSGHVPPGGTPPHGCTG